MLQRERKKRVEAAEAYASAGRAEQAAAERFEAELIEGYLPQQLSDEELAELVDAAVAETGATEQRQMGQVMSALMPKVGGRADGKRVSAAVRESDLARRQLTLDNTVAAELAGSEDAVLRALRGRLDGRLPPARQRPHPRRRLRRRADRGDRRRRAGRADRAGPRGRARDDRSGDRRPRRRREPGGDPRGRRLAPPQHQGRAEDAEPEALRRLDPPPHDHLRDRPGRHRQDLPRGGDGGARR